MDNLIESLRVLIDDVVDCNITQSCAISCLTLDKQI